MINTAFFGTSDKSIPILENLAKNTNLLLCVTKSDRVVGRKKEIKETLVKTWATKNNIELFEINKLDSETREKLIIRLKELEIEVGIVADFSFMIHSEIISTPKYGLINIHFSKLPKYRGASPVQHTILNGDYVTAITFMLMSKGMDEGDLLTQIEVDLTGNENSAQLYDKLFHTAGEHVYKVLAAYISGEIHPTPQNNSLATYCYSKTNPNSTLISKEDARIDWSLPHFKIERLIRAFNPWPIAWTTLGDLTQFDIFKGLALKPNKDPKLKIKIFDAEMDTNGNLQPTTLQVEGSNKMNFKDFINGYFEAKKT
jgi:methionyl-tRNA formyltransferase